MRSTILLAGIAAAAMLAPANAATVIEFRNVQGQWYDAVAAGPNTNATYANNAATGNATVRWGTGNPRSGYDFSTSSSDPSMSVDLGSPSAGTVIGDFKHLNYVIGNNTGITAVSLKFNTDVYVDGNFLQNVTFYYDFEHWETTNSGTTCANGGRNNRGVNANGCADRVKVNFNSQSDGFQIDNYVYALDIMGFIADGQEVSEFWTKEEATNKAQILGRVALYEELVPSVPGVPEPAAWALMLTGFGLVGLTARRRRETSSTTA